MGVPFGPITGGVEPGAPGGARIGVPFGPMAGGVEPGAPGGARTGIPSGPMAGGVDPATPGGASMGCPSGPIESVADPGVTGNPFGPTVGSAVGGGAETARARSPVMTPVGRLPEPMFALRGGE